MDAETEARALMLSAPPRLLHRRSQHGYTDRLDQALAGEPEAVPRDVQDLLTLRAARTARDRELDEWRERRERVAHELAWLYSQRLRRDVRAQLRTLQRQLDRLDAKLRA